MMSVDPEGPALLSIGLKMGGTTPQSRLLEAPLMEFMRLVARERDSFANDGLRANLVFNVPGPMFQPDFEGVHATRMDRKQNHLLVVAAVPAGMTADRIPSYVADVLRQTLREAHAYVARKRIPVSLGNLEQLAGKLINELEEDHDVA